MERIVLTLLCLFLMTEIQAQIEGHIHDQLTQEPIPYVNIWVKNKMIGTTSDEKGYFFLEYNEQSDTIVFSSIAYKNSIVPINELKEKIYLQVSDLQLQQIIVMAPKDRNRLRIGRYNKDDIHYYYGCGGTPRRAGKLFGYKPEYQKTPFLKELNFLTRNRGKEDLLIKLHILKATEDLNEDYEVLQGDILQTVSWGSRKTKVDLLDYQIRIPEEGIIIIVEWLIIEENKVTLSFSHKDSIKKGKVTSYEPIIGSVPVADDHHTFMYTKGRWHRDLIKSGEFLDTHYQNQYVTLAMELVLTD